MCELDLIFKFDEVHAILNEMIQGGLVLETNINEIVAGAKAVNKARKLSAASSSGNANSFSQQSSVGSGAGGILGTSGGAGWGAAGQVVGAFGSWVGRGR